MVWEERTSQQNSDVYGLKFDEDLTGHGSSLMIEGTNESWTSPAIAYSRPSDQILVAASVGNGTNGARVEAQLVDVGGWQLSGGTEVVSTIGSTQKLDVDVGGTNITTSAVDRFAIVWTQRFSATNHRVRYRVYTNDLTPSTNTIRVTGKQQPARVDLVGPGRRESRWGQLAHRVDA